MKVLMQSRKTLFSAPGGDTIQIQKTKEYLERLGISCDISLELEADLDQYDIVHIFNLMRPQEVYQQALHAKHQGKPVVLSPIYGLYTEYERKARPLPIRIATNLATPWQIEYIRVLARAVKNHEYHAGARQVLRYGYKRLVRETIQLSSILLPNSYSEMRRIEKDCGSVEKPFQVVCNAIDPELFNTENEKSAKQWPDEFRDSVICVANIAGRKNQLNLVRAMKGLPYQLLLVGQPTPNHKGYANLVHKEAPPNVHLLGHIAHRDLPSLYRLCKVHVLPSWMESPGLASLEAGAMMCNLVVTDRGDTEEYFGDHAYYCEPDSVESIRSAIVTAWNSPANPALRQHIMTDFTWSKAAEITLDAYRSL